MSSESPVLRPANPPADAERRQVRGRVGLFSIGLAAYWPQFPGLKERLEGYAAQVAQRVGAWADVVPAGLVDDAPGAPTAGQRFAPGGVGLIPLHTPTY